MSPRHCHRKLISLLAIVMIGGCFRQAPPPKPPSPIEFRLVVTPAELSEIDAEQLQESEVGLPELSGTTWRPLANLAHWQSVFDGSNPAEPAKVFSKALNVIAREREGNVFVLLYDVPKKCMVDDSSWAVQSAGITNDELGRQAIAFRLDRNGGTKMAALTGPAVGKRLAILVDGKVYSAPTLNSMIGHSGIIAGDFKSAELSDLTRRLSGR
jgi:hypothetical protein